MPTSLSNQLGIPCVWMRGGTSKAAFFDAADLPPPGSTRDAMLLAAMGHPDVRQIDGIGGGTPLTTKVAIVSRSTREDSDVDYLFAQIVPGESRVDYAPTCGNILAAVGPYAIERGWDVGRRRRNCRAHLHGQYAGTLQGRRADREWLGEI